MAQPGFDRRGALQPQDVTGFDVLELQADGLWTCIGDKSRTRWLFAVLEVSSRLWANSVLGRRSARNTKTVINDVIVRGRLVGVPLIATDGFEDYFVAIDHLIGPACVCGQVLQMRRNNRVVRVDRHVKIGTASRLENALWASEDSDPLNASFVERVRGEFPIVAKEVVEPRHEARPSICTVTPRPRRDWVIVGTVSRGGHPRPKCLLSSGDGERGKWLNRARPGTR